MIFFTNALLGLALVGEIGQVNLEILRRGIRYGFINAFLVVLGVVSADLVYLTLSLLGIITILNQPSILRALWIIGGLSIGIIAIQGFKSAMIPRDQDSACDKYDDSNPFVTGFSLNFLHPTNLIWWVTILGPIIISDLAAHAWPIVYLNGLGILAGGLIGCTLLASGAGMLRTRFPVWILRHVAIGSSCIMLMFALKFFYTALVM